MPIQGLTRLRKHQFGRQQAFGTKVAATRAYPAQGVPDTDLNWTDPEVDAGAIAVVVPPERGIPTFTANLSYPGLTYNDLTKILCGFFGGQEAPTGGGTAKTWTHDPPVTTPAIFDFFTYEFGDDVLTDWFQFGDGVVESFEITGPEGLGPLSATATWRFGSASSTGSTDSPVTGTVPTVALTVSSTDKKIYMKDLAIYIASSVGGLGAAQVSDALYSFTLRGSGDIDEKRWANGAQTFDANDIGRVSLAVELEAVFSKTADIVGTGSESDAWFSDDAVNRYVRLLATSTAEAQSGIPYSWRSTMPMRYYTRSDGEVGGNTTVNLTGHAFYDGSDFYESVLINQMTEAMLGVGGS